MYGVKIKTEKECKAMKIDIFSDAAATAFTDAQKLARTRTVSIDDARAFVAKLEKRLKSHGIPKKLWTGMEATFSPWAQNFPGAYKGSPEGTYFRVMRGSTKWYLTGVGREWVDKSGKNAARIVWPDDQTRQAVCECLHKTFVGGLA